jgi:REP element-mobilizing transposase RayT
MATRHSTRLNEFDYSIPGAYFITVVTYQRECLFGEVVFDEIELSALGNIARAEWLRSSTIRQEIELHEDEFIVMPNHVHGIVWITSKDPGLVVGATGRSPLRNKHTLINHFKIETHRTK